jgi:hypothetical protein
MTDRTPDQSATVEKTTTQLREFSGRAPDASRDLGEVLVGAYEAAVTSFVELERRAANAMPNEWFKAVIAAHAGFIEGVNGAYVKAVRGAFSR